MNDFLTIDTALAEAAVTLLAVSESPRLDAELLLARALDVPRSYLYAHADEEMDTTSFDRFQESIARRAEGMPLAYITGEKEFWSMTLMVSPATLVPRPETETIIEQALMRIPRKAAWRVLDLGAGSGAIALAIAKERPLCEIVATDISEDALGVARINAREHGIPNIEFVQGNWVEPVQEQVFDIIVSNPPYVADDDAHLDRLRHEPRAALAAGADGLDAIRIIAARAGSILKSGGTLLIEHGAEQHESIVKILSESGWSGITLVEDLSALPRVTVSIKH